MNTYATLVADDGVRDATRRAPRTAAPMPPPHVWVPWHCRNWPVTPAEEQQFAADLAHYALCDTTAPAEHSRRDVTAVLNALRGGLTVDELLSRAPGLHAAQLQAAYRDLERRRSESERAWWSIVGDATPDSLVPHGPSAATLLPVLVDRLISAVPKGGDVYRATVDRLAAHVESTDRDVHGLESALATWPERGVELGARLFNPNGDAVTNRVDHLARRVGTLTPSRVAALLGESPTLVHPIAG